jgi:catalase
LRNIDEQLASRVADGLGLALPDAAKAARPTLDMPTSDALSILNNGPNSFKGRKLGILLTDGSSAQIVNAITRSIEAVGGVWEIIAPKIGGVTLDDGSAMAAKQKIDGGPSVLYDAVAILPSEQGASLLAGDAASKDFVSDAFAHCKFVGHNKEATALFEKARIPAELDAGFIDVGSSGGVKTFVDKIGILRFWERELTVDLDS